MDRDASLLDEADAVYTRVVLDPARYAAETQDFVRRAKAAGAVEALVVGLRAEAWARHVLLDNEGARKLLDQGVRLASRHGLDRRLGDLLVTRAVALHELGRHADAARDLRRAEPLVAADERPDLRLQLAILDHNRGRLRAAAKAYRELLDDRDCPPMVWIKAANNLANAETLLGRPHDALGHLDRAAVLARDHSKHLSAVIADSRAWSTFHAGRLPESVRWFEEAGRLHAAAGLPLGEHHLEYTDVLRDLRLLDEAMVAARSAAVEFERHGARLMAAEARLRCARIALDIGDAPTAWTDAEAADRDFRRQRRPAWAARASILKAQAEAARDGYSLPALRRLSRAAATLQGLGLRAEATNGHLAAGRAALALHRPGTARRELTVADDLAHGQSLLVRLRGHLARALLAEAEQSEDLVRECSRGLHDLARHRAALPSLELRVLAAGHGAELGEIGLRRLLPDRAGGPDPAVAGAHAGGGADARTAAVGRGRHRRHRPARHRARTSRRPPGTRGGTGGAAGPAERDRGPDQASLLGRGGHRRRVHVAGDRRGAAARLWTASGWSSTPRSTGGCWPSWSSRGAPGWSSSARPPRSTGRPRRPGSACAGCCTAPGSRPPP